MNGTFDWLAKGTMASETGVSRPPKKATPLSPCPRPRAATPPFAGARSASRTTGPSFLPSTPPSALLSPTARAPPRSPHSPALWRQDLCMGSKQLASSRAFAMPACATLTSLPLETQQAAEIVARFLEASMVPHPATAARYLSPDLKITVTGGRKYGHPRET